MFDFGDELMIESYRIPWLIWIQLVVMLLLLVLLYSLSISPSDLSLNSSSAATAANAPSTSFAANRHHPLLSSSSSTATATSLHLSKVGGKQINEAGGPSTSRDPQRPKKENSQRIEDAAAGGSHMKDASHGLVFGESYHPCNFFGLAKQAFLKCLGLDSQSESSSPPGRKQGKKDD